MKYVMHESTVFFSCQLPTGGKFHYRYKILIDFKIIFFFLFVLLFFVVEFPK